MKPKILTDEQCTRLRREVAVRDDYKCVLCGSPAVDIAHIVPRSHGATGSAVIWQLKNMCCSCRSCHKETRAQRRKLLLKMAELYNYDYGDDPFRQYLIEEE